MRTGQNVSVGLQVRLFDGRLSCFRVFRSPNDDQSHAKGDTKNRENRERLLTAEFFKHENHFQIQLLPCFDYFHWSQLSFKSI